MTRDKASPVCYSTPFRGRERGGHRTPQAHCVRPGLSMVRPLRGRTSCEVRALRHKAIAGYPYAVGTGLAPPKDTGCPRHRMECAPGDRKGRPDNGTPLPPSGAIPQGQEGPEGVQPCLAGGERSEPPDGKTPHNKRPRRGRIAQGRGLGLGISRRGARRQLTRDKASPVCYSTPFRGRERGGHRTPQAHCVRPGLSMVRPLRGRTSCEVRALRHKAIAGYPYAVGTGLAPPKDTGCPRHRMECAPGDRKGRPDNGTPLPPSGAIPQGQEGPEGVQPCLAGGERSEPPDRQGTNIPRPRRGRIA